MNEQKERIPTFWEYIYEGLTWSGWRYVLPITAAAIIWHFHSVTQEIDRRQAVARASYYQEAAQFEARFAKEAGHE